MDAWDDLGAQVGVVLVVLLEEDGVNHHLVHDREYYHIFAKQKFLGRLSTIYADFYYQKGCQDVNASEEAGQWSPRCHEVDLNVHYVSPRCASL